MKVKKMNINKLIKSFCLYFLISITLINVASADEGDLPDPDERFNTIDIVRRTAEQLPACIEYCVIGACIHLEYLFPYGVNVVVSPRIQHYIPDLLVQAYKEPGEEPWDEWGRIFGSAKQSVMESIVDLMGAGGLGVGGRDVPTEEYNNGDRETFFKEVDVIGHPLALLPKIMNNEGEITPATEADGEVGDAATQGSNGAIEGGYWCDWDAGTCDDGVTENEEGCGPDCHDDDITVDEAYHEGEEGAGEYLENYGDASMYDDPRITRIFNVNDTASETAEMFEQVTEIMDMVDNMQAITDADVFGGFGIGVTGEFKIEEYMCDTPVFPFMPYYMSTMDTFFWRNGWPITDIEFVADVLNPFSPEAVKTDGHEWGNVYPRHGFLQQYHDKKAAAVMAARAVDVAVEKNSYRIRIPPPAEPSTGDWEASWQNKWTEGKWSELHPEPKKECHASVAYGGDAVDSGGKVGAGHYACTFWRQYDCCMQKGGIYALTVPIEKVCVVDGAPE